MSGKRVIVEWECAGVRCKESLHYDVPRKHRRVLTEGEYVLIEKVDGEWPLPVSINRLYWGDGAPVDVDEMLDYIAHALSDHTEGET